MMRMLKVACWVWGLGVGLALPVVAQTPAPPVHAPVADVSTPYYLGPEDILNIVVVNFSNLSVPQVAVTPDGTISLPLLDGVLVAGKTLSEVKQLLTEKWKRFVINPIVSVSLVQRRSESVYIFGFVGRTGKVDFRPGRHLLEVLSEVGGALPQGDLSQVTLTRKNGAKLVVDLFHPETKAGSEADVALMVGDLIYIPERRTQFSVVGQVSRPGSYEYKDNMSVLDALTQVGGILESADLASSTLIHNGKEQKLDLEALLKRGELQGNVKLAAGDRILVPELKNRNYVFGAVERPGYYLFKPGDRILDALNGAGGPIRDADMRHINRIRIDQTMKKPVVTKVDMNKFFQQGDIASNLLLEPGDVVYIATSKHSLGLQNLLSVFSGLSLMGGVSRMFFGY